MVTIRQATADDAGLLSDLLAEINAYYGSRSAGERPRIPDSLFGERPAATVLLAVDGDDVLGMASYSQLWPSGGAAGLFLKELFVRTHARRRGVARALMDELAATGRRLGCKRLEWTADTDNPTALAFYESLGARPKPGKVFYRQEF